MSFIGNKRDFHLPIKSVCVYCGSSGAVPAHFKTTAQDVGTALAQHGLDVVYGGGHVGLMGIVADAALKAGGKVTGIIPEHIRAKEVQHTGLTKLHVVPDMHTRKRMMVEQSDAFIVLPGGMGTLDETFEIITWKILGLHDKPIVIFNEQGFWDPLLALIDHMINVGFAQKRVHDLYAVATSVDEIFNALKKAPETKETVKSERM